MEINAEDILSAMQAAEAQQRAWRQQTMMAVSGNYGLAVPQQMAINPQLHYYQRQAIEQARSMSPAMMVSLPSSCEEHAQARERLRRVDKVSVAIVVPHRDPVPSWANLNGRWL